MEKVYHKNVINDLKEYNKFPLFSFDKGCKKAAKDWKKLNPKNDKEFQNFYKQSKNYGTALAVYNQNGRKLRLFSKIAKVIVSLKDIKTIVDYGCGAGSDSMELNDLGYKIIAMDLNTDLFKFFKFRLKKHKINNIKTINIKNNTKIPKCDLILSLDVFEHVYNPFELIKKMAKSNPKYILLTTAFGSHREQEAFCPWHTDYNIKKIEKFIEDNGYRKQKLNIPYPPKLFINIINIKEK